MKTAILRTIFLTALCAAACSGPGGGPAAEECDVRIAWDYATFEEMTSAPVANKGYIERELHYPRIKALSDGTLLMTFMNDHFGWDAFVRRSTDGGRTWSDAQMVRQRFDAPSSAGADQVVFVNPDFIELHDGRILLAYQWRYKKGYNDLAHTNENCGIEIMWSEDCGRTFSAPRRIYTGRCWEPAMLQLPSGEIQMYITDSNQTRDGISQPCTIVIRSMDGGLTWQGKARCTYRDGEIVSRTLDPRCTADGMPSAVWLDDNRGIAVPLEVWSGKYKLDQTPVVVRTDAETNWRSDQSIRSEGGPAYPCKKQLNKDFVGFGPYSAKLPTGEMIVLSNGVYRNVQGMWVFIGNKRADDFRFATSPFVGHWGSIDCIGSDRVLASGTFRYADGEHSRGGVRLMVGRLNRAKTIAKGNVRMAPVEKFDREHNDYWFLGKETSSSVFTDFGYTDECFILSTYLFDENLAAFTPENSDAPALLLARRSAGGGWDTYKIVVNGRGRWLLYREQTSSWQLVAEGTCSVDLRGTLNDASDTDLGFGAQLRIGWELLGGRPARGEVLRAHLRHHYKEEAKEGPVFALVEEAGGEHSDYPEEWLRITLR